MKNGNVPRQIMAEELGKLRSAIIKNHIAAGELASGRTMRSLKIEVSEEEGTLYGRNAFGTVETGRKAGRVPTKFTYIILQWMRDKKISVPPIPYKTDRPHKYTPKERGEMQFSYFVAKKIRDKGTKLYREGGRADVYSNEIPKTIERVRGRLMELVSMEVENIKINKETTI